MLIASTFSQESPLKSQTSTSYVIVHRDEERVLVPLPKGAGEHYEVVARVIKEEWNLEDTEVKFETKELSVCPGVSVQLRRECFAAGLLNEIGNVYVGVRAKPADFTTVNVKDHGKPNAVHEHEASRPVQAESADVEQTDVVVLGSDSRSDDASSVSRVRSKKVTEASKPGPSSEVSTKTREPPALAPPDAQGTDSQQSSGRTEVEINPSQASQTPGPTDAESKRVMVCIHDGNRDNMVAFRISPEATVLRVMKGACKHFKLDASKSVLLMVVGQTESGKLDGVKCDMTATIESLGVQELQEFFIESTS